MREIFQGNLEQLSRHLDLMIAAAVTQLRGATDALGGDDRDGAQEVIDADGRLDAARDACETEAMSLLALQAPVARDLRTVLAAIYCADRVERMGDLARHVAECACRAHPGPAVPAALLPRFTELGGLASAIGDQLRALLAGDEVTVDDLVRADDRVDRIQEELMAAVSGANWPHGVAAGVDVALLARYYERFADQAVTVAKRLDFIRTGRMT